MPKVEINGINIYYEVHGKGAPLVLIPGLSNDVSDYEGIIAALSGDYKVIAVDNRGAGRTDRPDMPYTIEMMAADTAGVLRALGIGKAHILGVSMGGRIAMALALGYPQYVRSLILVSTMARRRNVHSLRSRLFGLMLRMPVWRGLTKYPQPYYAVARQREASNSYDCSDRLGEINVPTLILHGKRDGLAPYLLAQEMHAKIKNSQMVTFNGGHLFLFFRPQQFIDAVLTFLRSIDAET
jgi:3-oxoadipate enol-lactonase